jgi:hypothetical protein
MASNYPTSLDNFTNPTVSDYLNSTTVPHATQHSDLNDAVENLQAKVGIDSSADTDSIDYKVADAASRITTLEAGATANAIVAYADLSARTAANPSPSEGDVSWQEDTNRFNIYNGSAWVYAGGGDATSFTPSWSGFTLGDGTDEWYYARVGDFIHVYGNTQLGSTSAVTGELQIDLPVEREALASTYEILGTAILFELGVAFWGGMAFSTNATTVRFSPLLANVTYVKQGTTSSTVPFTWGTGDAIGASFTYKAV